MATRQTQTIVRMWRGRERRDRTGAYRRHLEGSVYPRLRALPGFLGLSLLQRTDRGQAEMLVTTRWDSMASIEAFAGRDPESAVVEPEARAVLESFDDFVTHHEVILELGREDASDRPLGGP
ncbi:MAG: antibiotic biosynthesis monooxygenase [Hyphomicrobiales bacterium]|nr:antibiotic biosynthesis monooxygenase [Hyphomicrobiales bacterium]